MPAKLDRCVADVMAQGKDQSAAYAICNASIYPSKDKPHKKEPVYQLQVDKEHGLSNYIVYEQPVKPKAKSKAKSKKK